MKVIVERANKQIAAFDVESSADVPQPGTTIAVHTTAGEQEFVITERTLFAGSTAPRSLTKPAHWTLRVRRKHISRLGGLAKGSTDLVMARGVLASSLACALLGILLVITAPGITRTALTALLVAFWMAIVFAVYVLMRLRRNKPAIGATGNELD